MAFLQRKLFSLKKKEKGLNDYQNWSVQFPESTFPAEPPVRLLMMRDSDLRGKKLLFDSSTTLRFIQPWSKTMKPTDFDQVTNGIGYKYIHPSKKDTKEIGEMVFGTVPIADQNGCLKVHLFDNPNQMMWSVLFAPIQKQVTLDSSSQNSLDSSFGSGIGSSHGSNKGSTSSSKGGTQESGSDVGIFSSLQSCDSRQSSRPSVTQDSFSSVGLSNHYGSNCSLPGLNMNIKSSLVHLTEVTSLPKINIVPTSTPTMTKSTTSICSMEISPIDKNHLVVKTQSTTGKSQSKKVVLAAAIILQLPPGISRMLLKTGKFIEGFVSKVKAACQKAYQDRSIFIHQLYSTWMEATNDLLEFVQSPWLVGFKEFKTLDDIRRIFVDEFLFLRSMFDTKENQFFLSTAISAILTYNISWAFSINPSISDEDFDCHGPSGSLKQKTHLDSPPSQTVIVGSNTDVLKRLMCFISLLFQIFTNTKSLEIRFPDYNPQDILWQTDSEQPLLKNKSSFRRSQKYPLMSKSRLHEAELVFQDQPTGPENVVFELGYPENESPKTGLVTKKSTSKKQKSSTFRIISSSFQSFETHPNVRSNFEKDPIVISNRFLPGLTLQGCKAENLSSDPTLESVRFQLNVHCKMQRFTSDFHGIICNCFNCTVEICSSRSFCSAFESQDESFQPFIMSPLVGNILDSFELAAKISYELAITELKRGLEEIILQSRVCSAILIQPGLKTLDDIASEMDLDRNDIPLVMNVARMYNSEVKSKYGLMLCF